MMILDGYLFNQLTSQLPIFYNSCVVYSSRIMKPAFRTLLQATFDSTAKHCSTKHHRANFLPWPVISPDLSSNEQYLQNLSCGKVGRGLPSRITDNMRTWLDMAGYGVFKQLLIISNNMPHSAIVYVSALWDHIFYVQTCDFAHFSFFF
ncbi:hypothetical protein CEXT_778921 [Caerostris extrusa]|uniref:Uncharacterized protein n=1 Tax=Caerostris extrusa TaxID=172846 RepID=A0AAV4XR12_CAEEX|nr:hypothetical protein CEXT_778921 [Caerostris extrusa]